MAPSTSGDAHLGTLLSALLAWLDARSVHGKLLLRLDDLDRHRHRDNFEDELLEAFEALGLNWDQQVRQSDRISVYEAGLDALAAQKLLYPCDCGRTQVRQAGVRLSDGSYRYDGHCRDRVFNGGWRDWDKAIRIRLPAEAPLGDVVVRRSDAVIGYHLATVLDDIDLKVSRVVRGADLELSSQTQAFMFAALDAPAPEFFHHLLLMEDAATKLAKSRASVGWRHLRTTTSPQELCGRLAHMAGVQQSATPCEPKDLVEKFSWAHVHQESYVVPNAISS